MRLRPLIPVIVLSVACGAACNQVGPASMVPIEPPPQWAETLEAARERKDAFFRSSPDSPLMPGDVESFAGLEYWEPVPELYYAGPIQVHLQRESFQMVTTAGQMRPCERFGWIEFPVDGMPQRLEIYRLLDMGRGLTVESLLLPIADATTGKETYPAGRYVDLGGQSGDLIIGPGPDGRPQVEGPFVVDFNRAFNPSCAYGAPERFACPVTPAENRLKIRIEAGERGFKPLQAGASG